MKLFNLILMICVLAVSAPLFAKKKAMKVLRDNHNFNDLLVSGKYQFPYEATAAVEDDKLMSDLLEPRKEYKDRLKQSYMRR